MCTRKPGHQNRRKEGGHEAEGQGKVPSQEFHGPVDQVVVGTAHNHHHWAASAPPPPDDPGKSVDCPQCGYRTWRRTALCWHCHFDVGTHLKQEHRRLVGRRLRRFALVLAAAAGALLVAVEWLEGVPALLAQFAAVMVAAAALRAFGSSFD